MNDAVDKHTLDGLVAEHLPEALRFAVRLTGEVDTAEEVVAEALTRVARGWRTFRGEASFRTWLFRIVINAFRDQLAKRRPTAELPEDVPDVRLHEPQAEVLGEELGERIAAAVSRLPPRQREVLILTAYEGLKPRDVAEMLEISEENVHSTLHVARQRLKRELAPYLAEGEHA